jgi:hypothetical protein
MSQTASWYNPDAVIGWAHDGEAMNQEDYGFPAERIRGVPTPWYSNPTLRSCTPETDSIVVLLETGQGFE